MSKKANEEVFQAMVDYCDQSRRVPMPIVLQRSKDGSYGPSRFWGRSDAMRPFRPRWLLIEDPEGVEISDVKFGNSSQFLGLCPVPATLYSMKDALGMVRASVESWDRFKLESKDGLPVGCAISIHAELLEGARERDVIRCLYIGDEVKYRKWEAEVAGTLRMIGIEEAGPFVQIVTRTGDTVKVPVMPADVPFLSERIGRPVKFSLSTEG